MEHLVDEVENYRAYPECSMLRFRAALVPCGDAVPWESPDRWSADVRLACDAEGAVGPLDGEVWTRVAFDIPKAGGYSLDLTGLDDFARADVKAYVIACVPGCEESFGAVEFLDVSTPGWMFEPGRYRVRLSAPLDFEGSIRVTVTPRP